MIKKLLIVLTLLIAATLAHASDFYYASVSAGAANGTSCANAYAYNDGTNGWNVSAKVQPGNTLHACGTITFGTQIVAWNPPNSGTSGNPIIFKFETGAILQSPAFPGNPQTASCNSTCGAIEVIDKNFIIVDAGTNGIIRNTLNGATTMTCLGGTCTQGTNGSNGVYVRGNAIIVRNLNINNMYISCGASGACSDPHAGESNNSGINIGGASTNVYLCDNVITQAYGDIWTNSADVTATPTVSLSCASNAPPSGGLNIFQNTLTDSCHHITVNGSGQLNVWMNDVSIWTDWIWPGSGSGCHTDGFISYSTGATIMVPHVYDNFFHGDLGTGSPTAYIFCTYNGANGGSSCLVFNNILSAAGTTATGSSALMWAHSGSLGPEFYYNNTTLLGRDALDMDGDAVVHFTFRNNIFVGNGSTSNTYAWNQESSTQPWNTLTFTNTNVFYNLRPLGPFHWNATNYTTLAAWTTGCKTGTGGGAGTCDDLSTTGNPSLNAAFIPQTGSSAIGLGANLTSLGITPLDFGAPSTFGVGSTFDGSQRTTTGAWTAGAYNVGTSPPAAIIALSPNPLNFGNQTILTTSAPLTVTVTNSGNIGSTLASSTPVTITGSNSADFSVTGGTCTASVLVGPSGGTCTSTVTFTPSAGGLRSALLNVTDDAPASPQQTVLQGTGLTPATASITPNPINFGNQKVATTSGVQTLTLTNTSAVSLTLATGTPVSISGTNSTNFTLSAGGTCTSGLVVTAGGTCIIHVTFTPSASGVRSAVVNVSDSAVGSPQGGTVTGIGTAAIVTLTPTPLDFGAQPLNTGSIALVIMVTNTGTSPTTLGAGTPVSISGTNAADFTLTVGGTCTGNLILNPSAVCMVNVIFTPSALGARTAVFNIADDAPSNPQTSTIQGTGTIPTGPVGVGIIPSIVSFIVRLSRGLHT